LFSDIASLRRIVRNNKTAGKLLCIVAVPLNMSIAQLCQFLEPYFKFIVSLRAVREVNSKVRYMLLIEMKNAEKAEELYLEYNGKPFSSLEVLICFYFR
jgi:BRCA1-associated protein